MERETTSELVLQGSAAVGAKWHADDTLGWSRFVREGNCFQGLSGRAVGQLTAERRDPVTVTKDFLKVQANFSHWDCIEAITQRLFADIVELGLPLYAPRQMVEFAESVDDQTRRFRHRLMQLQVGRVGLRVRRLQKAPVTPPRGTHS